MPWKMVEAACACDDGLLRRQPSIRFDAVGDLLAGFYVRVLHVDSAYAKLLVAEQTLVMPASYRLDQVCVAVDLGDNIRFVPAHIEIAMSDLSIVVGTDRVVTLADVPGENIARQTLDNHVDYVDGVLTSSSLTGVK